MNPHPNFRRVLVVEDDATIVKNLVEYLEKQGNEVDVAYDGTAAMARLAASTYDVIVLDLGLPRVDGHEVLQHLRTKVGAATPVLILSARDALASKLESLSAGADDYLVKPFSLAEVAMRIEVLHRRASGNVVADVLSAGPLRMDRRTYEFHVGDVPVHLMPRSKQILEILMLDPGRVVPRTELEKSLWPDDEPGPDALRSQIHLLRRTLAQAGFDGLETVHGIGYRLKWGDQ